MTNAFKNVAHTTENWCYIVCAIILSSAQTFTFGDGKKGTANKQQKLLGFVFHFVYEPHQNANACTLWVLYVKMIVPATHDFYICPFNGNLKNWIFIRWKVLKVLSKMFVILLLLLDLISLIDAQLHRFTLIRIWYSTRTQPIRFRLFIGCSVCDFIIFRFFSFFFFYAQST